jgi:hypothetical protein
VLTPNTFIRQNLTNAVARDMSKGFRPTNIQRIEKGRFGTTRWKENYNLATTSVQPAVVAAPQLQVVPPALPAPQETEPIRTEETLFRASEEPTHRGTNEGPSYRGANEGPLYRDEPRYSATEGQAYRGTNEGRLYRANERPVYRGATEGPMYRGAAEESMYSGAEEASVGPLPGLQPMAKPKSVVAVSFEFQFNAYSQASYCCFCTY